MASRDPSPAYWRGKRVVVTGGAGFLGRPTVRMVEELGGKVRVPRSAKHDLTDAAACRKALAGADIVLHLAANVGGLGFNRCRPAALARDNLAMGLNVFEACRELSVGKLVAACSVCAYPRDASLPLSEESLWDGYPEVSNAPYGLAKKMLIVLSDAYRRQHGLDSCVPVMTNLYGPGDNFDLEDSHVVAAAIHKYVAAQAKQEPRVVMWGSGDPTREFLYVDDAARAIVLAAEHSQTSEPFNVGTGVETKIRDLAELISHTVGYEGETVWDASRPDGQPARRLDTSLARKMIGFEARTPLSEGLQKTIESFRLLEKSALG